MRLGIEDGAKDGKQEGVISKKVGRIDGPDGRMEGTMLVGAQDGETLGITVGVVDGSTEGDGLGLLDGFNDGCPVGENVGFFEGLVEGIRLGVKVDTFDGTKVGLIVLINGASVGETVGTVVGATSRLCPVALLPRRKFPLLSMNDEEANLLLLLVCLG